MEGSFDAQAIRNILIQLCWQSTEVVESESTEIKGWCRDERELADKIVDASHCLANANGGLLFVGIENSNGRAKFSACPHRNTTPDWIISRIQDSTHPPVDCKVYDISELAIEVTDRHDAALFLVVVERTKHPSGHVTNKGISRIRVGKECRPNFSVADDDRSAAIVPGITIHDLSVPAVEWAMHQHARKFNVQVAHWESPWEFLAHGGLLQKHVPEEAYLPEYRVPLATLLLFGSEQAIQRSHYGLETVVIGGIQPTRFRRNIVETHRELFGGKSGLLISLVPHVSKTSLHELLVNAYIHRCYRSNGPVVIRVSESSLEVENPGELAPGLHVENLLYCVPVYRNFLLADGARFIGLCDKIGQGINVVFEDILSGGFPFPTFESGENRFTARIGLLRNPAFRDFLCKRGQALPQLDEVVVLRWLWERGPSKLLEIATVMQRGHPFARRLLEDMRKKQIIEPSDGEGNCWQLTSVVQHDIETVHQREQMDLGLDLFGTGYPS